MQVEGTKEAFITLLNERGIYKRLGVERSTVSSWKIRMNSGEGISLDKMEEMLLKAGATVVSEKVWEVDTESRQNRQDNMADFYEELSNIKVGDKIVIEASSNIDVSLAVNAIFNHADKIKASISRDGIDPRSTVTYIFFPRKP